MSTKNEVQLLMDHIDDLLNLRPENIEKRLYEIPKLHNKILRLFFKHKLKLQEMNKEVAILYHKKWHHYKNEYDYELSDKQCIFYIEGDEEYSKIKLNCNRQKVLVEYLEKAVDRASRIGWEIKNILDYLKYVNGGV